MGGSAHTEIAVRTEDAVLDVDVQTTFMPGGGLPVAEGDLIIPVVKKVHGFFPAWRRYASLDRHPLGHISLASSYVGHPPGTMLTEEMVAGWTNGHRHLSERANFCVGDLDDYLAKVKSQILWPDHAIAGTTEAELHPELADADHRVVVVKGTDPRCDSYSAFRDNLRRPTGLADAMREHGVKRLFLTGLAFDFCVGWTALDAADEGFEALVIEDATRPVNLPGSVDKMRADLAAKGVKIISSAQLVRP
jgi:nicotinamidase/pyrazinamidase